MAREASESTQKALDLVIEEAGALTFFGLAQISDGAARKFVEFGLWTRGHSLGYPSTLGKKVAVYGLLGVLASSAAYRLGLLDGVVRRVAERVLSDGLGTRVSIQSVGCWFSRGRVEVRGLRVDEWPQRHTAAAAHGWTSVQTSGLCARREC